MSGRVAHTPIVTLIKLVKYRYNEVGITWTGGRRTNSQPFGGNSSLSNVGRVQDPPVFWQLKAAAKPALFGRSNTANKIFVVI